MQRSILPHVGTTLLLRCATGLVLVATMIACPRPRSPQRPTPQRVREILSRGRPFSENSFYTCLMNGYAAGRLLKDVQAECETKLSIDDERGFGRGDLVGSVAGTDTQFDPASVTASCSSGNPLVAGGPQSGGRIIYNYYDGTVVDYGRWTHGGGGTCDPSGCYRGLSESQSEGRKFQAIDTANRLLEAARAAQAAADADPDDAAKQKAAEEAKAAADKAVKEAQKDPNKADPAPPAPSGAPTVSTPTGPGGSTPCDEALQAARELLAECQRTGWRDARCQMLQAYLNNCPDPTRSFIDPESGYTCGEKMDPEAVKDAWLKRCRELRRPAPGGPDPCEPPNIDQSGRFIGQGAPDDMCNSLIAIVDPDDPQCIGTLTIERYGRDPQELLTIALNKIGGPIVVLPNRDPSPPPGPPGEDPRPGPRP